MRLTLNKKQKVLAEFVLSYSPSDFFRRYELFKFLTLVVLLGSFTSLLVYAVRAGMIVLASIDMADFWTFYVWNFFLKYWIYHWWYLLIVLPLVASFRFNWFKRLFFTKIEFIIPPKRLDPEVANFFSAVNNKLAFLLLLGLIFVALPLLHLFNLNFYQVFIPLAFLFLPYISNGLTTLTSTRAGYLAPLSRHTFENISYQSASGAPLSEELKEELRRYRALKAQAPIGADALDFAAKSKDNKFKGFTDLFYQLEVLFDAEGTSTDNFTDRICLHNKTSDAIEHAIELIDHGKNETVMIYSDAEFAPVKAVLRERKVLSVPGHLHTGAEEKDFSEIPIEDWLLNDSFSVEKYGRLILKKIEDIHSKKHEYTRFCVVLTHVYHQTGKVLLVSELIDQINKGLGALHIKHSHQNFKIIYLVDGAQAVGNIRIHPDILKKCHFYAACGQKWLLGQYSMGILLRNDKLLHEDHIKLNEYAADSEWEAEFSSKHHRAKSIPYEPYISTSIMLSDINHHGMKCIEEHNQRLAKLFVNGLYELNNIFEVINTDCASGLVTIRTGPKEAAEINGRLAEKYNISGDLFETEEGGTDKSNLIRFSFHYFMGERDVNKLLYALLDIAHGRN